MSGPVVVVSSAIRRFAFTQYEPPAAGQVEIHGTHIFFGEGTEMFLIPVTIRGPSVLNEFISLAPIWRVLVCAQFVLPCALVPSTCMLELALVPSSEM